MERAALCSESSTEVPQETLALANGGRGGKGSPQNTADPRALWTGVARLTRRQMSSFGIQKWDCSQSGKAVCLKIQGRSAALMSRVGAAIVRSLSLPDPGMRESAEKHHLMDTVSATACWTDQRRRSYTRPRTDPCWRTDAQRAPDVEGVEAVKAAARLLKAAEY